MCRLQFPTVLLELKNLHSGTRSIRELQRRAKDFVEEHLFDGEKHPDMFRRRFRPSRRKTKNLITSVKLEKQHSKIDQANVEVLKKQWGKWADIHFSPR